MFHILVIALAFVLLVWYAQYHWRRRRMYQLAAKVNGPVAFPFIGNALYFYGNTGDAFDCMMRLTSDFQSPGRVWLGQELVIGIWTAEDLEIILNKPHALAKADLYKFANDIFGTGLFTAPVPKWKKHRKIISPTFNQKILDDFVEVFSQQSDVLIEKLKTVAGKETFDIFHHVARCTLDIICETAIGITVNAQETELSYVEWSNTAMEILLTRVFTIIYHFDFIFNRTSMSKKYYDAINKMKQFTGSIVAEKRKVYQQKLRKERPEDLFEEEPRKKNSFLEQLIELSEKGADLTDEEISDEVNTFLIAASDTTASTSSFIFVMLGMFPVIQDKVWKEVIDVFGADRPVESKDLGKLQYLEMVIKETLRLFPVAPIMGRAVTKDITLKNCVVPAGSTVGFLIMALHRDPNVWPNPLNFDPNRFLPEEVAKRHHYSWLPFSGGPRNCVGIKYGMMTMKTLVATVIRKCRFKTDYKSITDIKLKLDMVLKPRDGYRVSMELRK